jgi:protein-tyrosine-phosphatase
MRVAFVCVQNAGRSQMATAFAERERAERGLEDEVSILTGGTHPAEAVHDVVVEAMGEVDVGISGRTPREVSTAELDACDVVATMGCSTLSLDTAVDVRDWDLPDPDGKPMGEVREIRATVRERVAELFDEIETGLAEPTERTE